MTELHLGENDLQVRNEKYFKLSPDVFHRFSISNLVAFFCAVTFIIIPMCVRGLK